MRAIRRDCLRPWLNTVSFDLGGKMFRAEGFCMRASQGGDGYEGQAELRTMARSGPSKRLNSGGFQFDFRMVFP
jgi:hypothetical protein